MNNRARIEAILESLKDQHRGSTPFEKDILLVLGDLYEDAGEEEMALAVRWMAERGRRPDTTRGSENRFIRWIWVDHEPYAYPSDLEVEIILAIWQRHPEQDINNIRGTIEAPIRLLGEALMTIEAKRAVPA